MNNINGISSSASVFLRSIQKQPAKAKKRGRARRASSKRIVPPKIKLDQNQSSLMSRIQKNPHDIDAALKLADSLAVRNPKAARMFHRLALKSIEKNVSKGENARKMLVISRKLKDVFGEWKALNILSKGNGLKPQEKARLQKFSWIGDAIQNPDKATIRKFWALTEFCFKRGDVDRGIEVYYHLRKMKLMERFSDRMSKKEAKKYVEDYLPRYMRYNFIVKWPARFAMRLIKGRIDEIQTGLKDPKLSSSKKAELRAEYARLKNAIALSDGIPSGAFQFADARKVASKAKAQILIGILNDDPLLFQRGIRTAERLKLAKVYSDGAKRVVKPYLELFPKTLREAVHNGTKDFPVLSDDYDGHQLEWGPRPKIIEKLPVVAAFKEFKKRDPAKAKKLVGDLKHILRSNLGLIENESEFEKKFKKWKMKFDSINWQNTKIFSNKMRDLQVEKQPPLQTHIQSLLFLDGVIASLKVKSHWDQKKLGELAYELVKVEKTHRRITKANALTIDTDVPLDLNMLEVSDGLIVYDDPVLKIVAENNGFSFDKIENRPEDIKRYAGQIREKVVKALSKELDDAIDGVTKGPGVTLGELQTLRALKKEIVSGKLEAKDRGNAIVRLFYIMRLAQNKAMTNSMLKALKVYRKKDKALMTCSWKNLDTLVWLSCRGAALVAGSNLNYNDKTFTPFIEDLESVKEKLNNPIGMGADIDEGMDEFDTIWNSQYWPKVRAEGERALKVYNWTHIASNIVIIVASALVGHWAGSLARVGTLARLGKGLHDAAKLARIARLAEGAAFAITFTQMEMGLTSNTWLGYNFKKDRWEIPRTIEKTMINAAMFATGNWALGRFNKSVEAFANARGINLLKASWKTRALVGFGRFASVYAGFTLFEGFHGIYEAGKREGFANVLTSEGKVLREFGKAFAPKRMLYRAAFLAAVSVGSYVGSVLTAPVNRKIAKFALGRYESLMKELNKQLETASRGFDSARTAKDTRSLMKSMDAIEEVLMGYAAIMRHAGLKGTERFSEVWNKIRKVRTLHDLFSADCRIAGARRVDGDFTYKASKKVTLLRALRSVDAKVSEFKDGKIIATIEGTAHMFTPRKQLKLSDGPGKIAVETWKNLTPAQKTAAWYIGFPILFNAAFAFPKIFGAIGLLGVSHYTVSKTSRPKTKTSK
jgi:hypothetical protein